MRSTSKNTGGVKVCQAMSNITLLRVLVSTHVLLTTVFFLKSVPPCDQRSWLDIFDTWMVTLIQEIAEKLHAGCLKYLSAIGNRIRQSNNWYSEIP